ncbi:type IV secretory system conjugative DNA transfer family protein [Hyphococcus flavus]|uniref:Type IV secretory system conjugative DNA transfer family protein n=1 Tax=Hyphococcus flavus TaxID=1866326 RepID=A0AAE9ZEA3_9PROT|nr:type IV secretory system conjugative DNA transfer family protein [Hyphococcus flavus]WDI33046.1 type IV secretory system conjugative DNA transfer family protein [Hyphococcus flavus]
MFRTPFDPQPIVSVEVNTLTMVSGSSGSGKKAQIVTPMLTLIDEPMVYIDPQREAEEDVPLRAALGRYVYVFDPRRRDSASVNVLAGLLIDQPDFLEIIELIVDDLCPEGGAEARTEEGIKYTRRALRVAIANEAQLSFIEGRPPSLVEVGEALGTDRIVESMRAWADFGHRDFRRQAEDFHFDFNNDPEVRGGVASFIQRDLSWLSDQNSARLVTGETGDVADPRDMLGDRIKCDWFLQPGENLDASASLWRILLGTVRRERRKLTKAQARSIGTPTWFIVDEFPRVAGAGAKTFDALVVTDRQKLCLPVYIYQHDKQIAKAFGEGTLKYWRDSASLRISLTPDPETAREIAAECGKVYHCEMNYSGEGDGVRAHAQRQWTPIDAVSENVLASMKMGDVVCRYASPHKERFTIVDTGPLFFKMPLFKSYVEACMRKYPFPFKAAYYDKSEIESFGQLEEK